MLRHQNPPRTSRLIRLSDTCLHQPPDFVSNWSVFGLSNREVSETVNTPASMVDGGL